MRAAVGGFVSALGIGMIFHDEVLTFALFTDLRFWGLLVFSSGVLMAADTRHR